MGNPKKTRKKYSTPAHPWMMERLDAERKIVKEYGPKNKTEIWKMDAVLKNLRANAKRLIADVSEQGVKEKQEIIQRVKNLNLVKKDDVKLEDVLSLELKDIMERRLQTVVWKKGMAKTVKQARQFIRHGHVQINGQKVDVPSYLVLKNEEDKIGFVNKSALSSPDHPERILKKAEEKKKIKEERIKEAEKEKPKKEPKEKKEEVKSTEVLVGEVKEEKKEAEKPKEDKK